MSLGDNIMMMVSCHLLREKNLKRAKEVHKFIFGILVLGCSLALGPCEGSKWR